MVIDFNDERTWPADVLAYIEGQHDLFRAWEDPGSGSRSVAGWEYDAAVRGLRAVLIGHALHGYHCTRLTTEEIQHILAKGMQLPNGEMLRERIQAVLARGLIEPEVARRLMNENQADEPNRANRLWFCFFPPRLAGRLGICRLLGRWGGEALYNTHERDPQTGSVLAGLGRPCLVEADIAISSLREVSFLDVKAARQFLVWRGFESSEPNEHEDYTTQNVPAASIRRVIQFPEPDFLELTGCGSWNPSLT